MISLLLLLCLCAGLILPAAAADASVPADYWTDSGNYTEPTIDPATKTVTIKSAAELAWVAWKCMQSTTFGEYTILLENDLDLSAHLWMPIGGRDKDGNGSDANAFAGVFDGQGHRIYGMVCVDPDDSYKNYTALFGVVSDGEIRNLSVEGSVSAYANAAILIDRLTDGSVVLNCGVAGAINTSVKNYAGALIGSIYGGTIYNCFANCVFSIRDSQYCGNFLGFGYKYAAVVNCCWNAETMEQPSGDNFENCYAIPANNTVDYASKLNAVMVEGAAKWVMDETGYPALDFQNRVQSWGEAAEAVSPVNGVYYIDRPGQLAYIAKIVNEGNTLKGQTVLLRSDLDLSGKSWIPIGFWTDYNKQTNFFGELNGNHKTITGLTIPRNAAAYKNGYAGLFGYTTLASSVHDLTLQGSVQSVGSNCGLLAGGAFGGVTRCTVAGEVSGRDNVGGIAGRGCRISQCNAENVTLTATGASVGGILGKAEDLWGEDDHRIGPNISQCCTSGTIVAVGDVGGIVGADDGYASELSDCYSSADLTKTPSTHYDDIGGIAGFLKKRGTMKNCYFTGSVTGQTSDDTGLIVGYSYVSSDETLAVTSCYWSTSCKMTIDGMPANRHGVGTSSSEDPTSGLTLPQMQTKSSYAGWDFDTVWGMDANKNGGLPYLRWQTNVPAVVEPTALSLTPEQATLAAGRSTTLTAVFYPIGAGGKLDWSSNAPDVASVTSDGQVTARREGTAIITAKCGSLSASCSVTVTGRSSDEYTIHEIMLKDANGSAVTGIPSGSFWAYVSVTKGENAKEATVLLVSYDQNDQYLGLTALEADVPCGTTYKLGAWFANTNRRVAKIKALVVDGVGTMHPLAAAAEIG